ncbi:hypothetical protein N7454_010527 [Penicillium verhagenii]|nr:hypothetical protein N7454_010527 [Penicillium verhagenii]
MGEKFTGRAQLSGRLTGSTAAGVQVGAMIRFVAHIVQVLASRTAAGKSDLDSVRCSGGMRDTSLSLWAKLGNLVR